MKRCRGWGLYAAEGANTTGKGNIWLSGRAVGFLWDNPQDSALVKPFPFMEGACRIGILDWLSLHIDSRMISYFWEKKPQFGHMQVSTKVTTPNNEDLRFEALGLRLGYRHNFLNAFPSISGLRTNDGTGFCPEGFYVGGGSVVAGLQYERDFIAKFSVLPLKAIANAGVKVPLDPQWRAYAEYTLSTGASFYGRNYEAFCEFTMEGLVNNNLKPKKFAFRWAGDDTTTEIWEVAFTENPMYLQLGGRLRYENGITLMGCVPILLSYNQGSALIDADRQTLQRGCDNNTTFADECARGINTPFDPWYTKWKIIMEISFPLRYRQTGAEMRRFFLISKNIDEQEKIDIDRRLKQLNEKTPQDTTSSPERSRDNDTEKRLRDIEKRRKEILQQQDDNDQ
jgi:hypothetical protein